MSPHALTRCPAGHILGDAARVFGCPVCKPPRVRRSGGAR